MINKTNSSDKEKTIETPRDYLELQRRRSTAGDSISQVFGEFGQSVQWDRISPTDVESFRKLLDRSPGEHEVHRFLEGKPEFLVQVLGGGHGRCQLSKYRERFLSKPKLGAEYIPDFLIAEASSIGIQWHCVELKAPSKGLQTQDGRELAPVCEAIHQIRDWRKWLQDNRRYARAPSSENGLGLASIDSRIPGLIIVGRSQNLIRSSTSFAVRWWIENGS
ncbi:MAG: DUF4263 domain-containing protein [bacterium]|nr:DUF4263 domain-containing protein [bacterium]